MEHHSSDIQYPKRESRVNVSDRFPTWIIKFRRFSKIVYILLMALGSLFFLYINLAGNAFITGLGIANTLFLLFGMEYAYVGIEFENNSKVNYLAFISLLLIGLCIAYLDAALPVSWFTISLIVCYLIIFAEGLVRFLHIQNTNN